MYYSVIVTVYKVEPYLKQCVDSILAQTFDDFELILVDDGSPDRCAVICDAYARTDARVKVLHQDNRGVAHARKSGLMASQGRYIVFVDGDDWVDSSFLWFGNRVMESKQPDMICFACSYEYGEYSEKMYEPANAGLYEGESIRKHLYPSVLMDSNMSHMSYSVFAKVFSRQLAESCFLGVDERISLGEDMLCTMRAYLEAKSIYISHVVTNFYRVQERSASHGFQIGHYRQLSMVIENLQKASGHSFVLPEDFDRQTERYGAFMCFAFLNDAAGGGCFNCLKEIREQTRRPILLECLQHAEFEKISLKTRITFFLLRRKRILPAYCLLSLCRRMKNRFRGKKVVD